MADLRLSRVHKELQRFHADTTLQGMFELHVDPHDAVLGTIAARIMPPPSHLYHGQTLSLTICTLFQGSDYPMRPPIVRFEQPQPYHPNISCSGSICLDILSTKWKASYTIMSVLNSILVLLEEPNVNSPLNGRAATSWGKSALPSDEFLAILRGTARKRPRDDEGGGGGKASRT